MPRRACLVHLDVHRVVEIGGEQVVMVGGGGDARHQQFGQRQPRGQPHSIGRQPRPDGVKRLQPVEQLLVDGLRVGARQRLVEMMVRIDEARQHHVARGIEDLIHGCRGRLSGLEDLRDPPVAHDDPRAVLPQNRQRRPDQKARHVHPLKSAGDCTDPLFRFTIHGTGRRTLPIRSAARAPTGRGYNMTFMKAAIASLAALAAVTGIAMAQEMKKEIGPGEGQVDIVAWPGYIERGRDRQELRLGDRVREEDPVQGQHQDRRHLG